MKPALEASYKFLYDNANPIIKNEAATALGIQDNGIRKAMLDCPDVQYWIDCLNQFTQKRQAHNADDYCLENAMHKLASFGVKETDDTRIKETNDFILDYIHVNRNNPRFFDSISNVIAASWLAYAGRGDDIIADIISERINAAYQTAKEKNYNIYVSPQGYPAIPRSRAMHPLVNPALYENNIWKLPTVHDVFAYSHLPEKLSGNKEITEKIETIVEYIMDDRYQRFNIGYGLMLYPPKTYYGMGWSVHLPGLSGQVWCMELISFSQCARNSEWFKKTLGVLSSLSSDGIYEFPSEALGEAHRKYYVGGGHMGLGEDRRKKAWRKIESTAWMLRILKNCD